MHFTVESTSFKSRFMAQINNSFGGGRMSLALNNMQFCLLNPALKKHKWVIADTISSYPHWHARPTEQ